MLLCCKEFISGQLNCSKFMLFEIERFCIMYKHSAWVDTQLPPVHNVNVLHILPFRNFHWLQYKNLWGIYSLHGIKENLDSVNGWGRCIRFRVQSNLSWLVNKTSHWFKLKGSLTKWHILFVTLCDIHIFNLRHQWYSIIMIRMFVENIILKCGSEMIQYGRWLEKVSM